MPGIILEVRLQLVDSKKGAGAILDIVDSAFTH
jgi:hypothetical protein